MKSPANEWTKTDDSARPAAVSNTPAIDVARSPYSLTGALEISTVCKGNMASHIIIHFIYLNILGYIKTVQHTTAASRKSEYFRISEKAFVIYLNVSKL